MIAVSWMSRAAIRPLRLDFIAGRGEPPPIVGASAIDSKERIMKPILFTLCLALAVATSTSAATATKSATPAAKPVPKPTAPLHAWSMDATVIEACSCPMFCPTYLGGAPVSHHDDANQTDERYCRFDRAIKVNRGHYHDVSLDGAKFWIAGDLGPEVGKAAPWAVVTYDRALTDAQRDAISQIVAKLYPIQFQSLATDEADLTWVLGPGAAHALLNNGHTAEVALEKGGFGQDGKAPVIADLRYWAASSNTGFTLMPSTILSNRAGTTPFEYHGTSGFVTTFEIHGDDPAPAVGAKNDE
jgi:hypothetical protein